jgi:hypothetical protein
MGSHLLEDWPGPVSEMGCAASKVLTSAGGGVAAITLGLTSESSVLPCMSLVGHVREMEGGTTSSMEKVATLVLSKTPPL